jgi:hypothetical protein
MLGPRQYVVCDVHMHDRDTAVAMGLAHVERIVIDTHKGGIQIGKLRLALAKGPIHILTLGTSNHAE